MHARVLSRRFAAIALVASLGACAGSTGAPPPLPANGASSLTAAARSATTVETAQRKDRRQAHLTLRIRIPKQRRHARGAHYISAATKGMTMAFTGPTAMTQAINLTPSDPRCSGSPLTCEIGVSLYAGSYTVTVDTYDQAPVSGAIPVGAKLLSIAKNAPLSVQVGKANTFGVALDGVPASLFVSGLPSGAAGTAFNAPQSFSVAAKDADNDLIVGPYDTPVNLSDSDESGATTIATAGTDGPPSGKLLSSTDTATFNYSGRGIVSAAIGASATDATGGSAIFAPTNVDVVTLSTDSATGATPGICPAGNSGDLRYAMCNANAGAWIVFNCGDPCTITLGAPLPPVVQNQTIDGGSFGNVIIDGASLYRAFFVDTGTVSLANLRIQNAKAQGGAGGFGGGGGGAGLGAGLFVNQATALVSISNLFFLDDAATGGSGIQNAYYEASGGGGGGLAGSGGSGGSVGGDGGGAGGGGVLTYGSNPDSSGNGSNGGAGGGGGGGAEAYYGAAGNGGTAYAGSSSGTSGGTDSSTYGIGGAGGAGGFGGGGGGGGLYVTGNYLAGANGGAGGFGGGGGGGSGGGGGAMDPGFGPGGNGGNGGAGGPGGGGGAGAIGGQNVGGPGAVGLSGDGGALATVTGGNASTLYSGGGAAAGPAIFVNAGTLTTSNSGAGGSAATGGTSIGGTAAAGTADATPVFNYAGTVNRSTTIGPVTSALSNVAPSLRGRAHARHV